MLKSLKSAQILTNLQNSTEIFRIMQKYTKACTHLQEYYKTYARIMATMHESAKLYINSNS